MVRQLDASSLSHSIRIPFTWDVVNCVLCSRRDLGRAVIKIAWSPLASSNAAAPCSVSQYIRAVTGQRATQLATSVKLMTLSVDVPSPCSSYSNSLCHVLISSPSHSIAGCQSDAYSIFLSKVLLLWSTPSSRASPSMPACDRKSLHTQISRN